ncbi:MAG: multiheme c-type cytochrome [Acidobacteriaceae bacterium]
MTGVLYRSVASPENKRRAVAIVIALVLAAPLSAEAGWQAPPTASTGAKHQARKGYVGDDACLKCHAETVASFHRTTHYLTSSEASETSILGKFTAGNNIVKTANPGLYFRMDERRTDGGKLSFSQTAVEGDAPDTTSQTEPIDIVIGSGEKGQTYLYWKGDELFELPISYWASLGWVNSPGYRDGYADFDRLIIPRCLECHATYFESRPPPINRYNPADYALGIQCEVCHGPGQEHVEWEKSKSAPRSASAMARGSASAMDPGSTSGILNPARFSRERQMDLCAWCHAGLGWSLQPAYSYRPGDQMSKYIDLPPPGPSAPPDVHGNQVGMLEKSLCFRSSNMTCMTCHDVHVTQHDAAYFSHKCLTCHKPDSATFSKPNHPVTNNCIDCHMPRQHTNQIVFNSDGKRMTPEMRNHWIRVYPETQASVANH